MTALAQIAAQVDTILARDPNAHVIAIRAEHQGDWPPLLERRSRRFAVRWCATGLALREALVESERAQARDPGGPGLVVMTPMHDHEVPDDIRARLARARVFQFRGWQVVEESYKATAIDARLGRLDWMPEMLIEAAARGFSQPVATGFLDQESAWATIVRFRIGLDSARPDASTLMAWTLLPDSQDRIATLPDAMRHDLFQWWLQRGDPAITGVIRAIEAGFIADVAALGLVCSVLFAPSGSGEPGLMQAVARFERYVGDRSLSAREGEAWSLEAQRLAERMDGDARAATVARADTLLRDIRATEHAVLSAWLPSGFEQRIGRFAVALDHALNDPKNLAAAVAVEGALEAVEQHRRAAEHDGRVERLRMATRLLRWLQLPEPDSHDLSALAGRHADDDAYADWARFRLLGGDELSAVSRVFARLRAAVAARREVANRAFAEALVRSAGATHQHPRLVPVEDILAAVIAPLASERRNLLVLVVDGLSVAIFRELFAKIQSHGWVEWLPEGAQRSRVGLAALPTVTEISRASLLIGRLTRGTSGAEKSGFAANEASRQLSAAGRAPRLFHKGELALDGDLAPAVRDAIRDPQQRFVGIVHNAVDDHLSGPEQLNHQWSLEHLRLLLPLLREAREANRVLVVTADHGHVLEDGSVELPGTTEAPRWRSGGKATVESEIAISGPRVIAPEGSLPLVCLWTEKARYKGRKTGYHGGVAPAEVLVPLSVFAPPDSKIAGYELAPPQLPAWWQEPSRVLPASVVSAPPPKPARRRTVDTQEAQTPLFGAAEPTLLADGELDWIGQLLGSPIYVSQRQLAMRVAQPDDVMRKLISELAERGGKLGRAALAQRLGIAEMRLGGFLVSARRLLNVDQSPVLVIDEQSGTIELNLPLLQQQFGIRIAGVGAVSGAGAKR